MSTLLNADTDHKIIAKHFGKSNESMRQLKRNYEANKGGFWMVYIKAYNCDKRVCDE